MGLHDEDENWITVDNSVEKVAVNYFDNLFSTTSPSEFYSFLEEITRCITSQMNQQLLKIAT